MPAKLFTVVVALFLALAFSMFLFIDSLNDGFNEATGLVVGIESFPTYLETHPVMNSLSRNSDIELVIGETIYEINGRDVYTSKEESDGKDIKITLPQGYESVIGELGICNSIRKANNDNSLNVEVYVGKTTLLFKYGKLIKYGDCLS